MPNLKNDGARHLEALPAGSASESPKCQLSKALIAIPFQQYLLLKVKQSKYIDIL
jgi:hypothetical protein